MLIIESFFYYLSIIDEFFWGHIGFSLVLLLGIYFTIKSRFFQFRTLANLTQTIRELYRSSEGDGTSSSKNQGVHPLRLYFASVGGMIGLGNVVAVITALLLGGPGSLFWLWLASIFGMLIKYSEIYLGVKFRVKNDRGGYDGGPMYYLAQAFKPRYIPYVSAILLCIYGVEVYQFLIITDTMVYTFDLSRELIIAGLICLILYTALGGVNRLASVCVVLMPAFMILYVLMCLWVIGANITLLPEVLSTIVYSAFTGHAAVGGFAGSTMVLAAQNGIARAVYSGDIGIGYDATLQSETSSLHPERQARMAILALTTDSLVCTMSMLVVLITGLWHSSPNLLASEFVATALSQYFPHMNYFMAVFFFLAGFTTIIAFFAVGMKCSRFLSERWGEKIYMLYAIFAFSFFSFFDQSKVMLIMSVSGGLLMLLNLSGIVRLRKHIEFK
jgi:AGCS family alanine or glycine:cation symporter